MISCRLFGSIFAKYLYYICICLLFSASIALSQNISLSKADNSLKVKTSTYDKFSFKNTLSNIKAVSIKTPGGMYSELKIPSYGSSSKVGYPKLPVMRKLIEVPVGAKLKVNIISRHTREISKDASGVDLPIAPCQPHLPKDTSLKPIEFKKDAAAYRTNAFLRADTSVVSVKYLGIMRGFNIALLSISPVEYNPVTNSLKIYDILDVEIKFENPDIEKTLKLKELSNSSPFNSASRNIINYKNFNTKTAGSQKPVKYVIVSDPMFRESLKPFIQWKRKSGYNIIEAYTDNPLVGNTKESIREYLKTLFLNASPANPPHSYILLVGDVAQIPAFNGTADASYYFTDLPYAEYTGDYLPEAFYGRFSANNPAELIPQINKTLEYEQYAMPDPSYLNNAVLIAGYDKTYSWLFANGQINYIANNYFNNNNNNFNTFVTKYPNSRNQAENIKMLINEGAGFVNYSAHGTIDGWVSPRFNNSDVGAMTNSHMYPVMIGNACYTQAFQNNACFGEALLRAENKGAVAYIGASAPSFWDEDYWWSVGFCNIDSLPKFTFDKGLGVYDRLFHSHDEYFSQYISSLGEIIHAGNIAVMESGSLSSDYYWEIYNLMGDPSLMPYLKQPIKLYINYENSVSADVKSVKFITEPLTYIALSFSDTLLGAGFADSNGVAVININTNISLQTSDIRIFDVVATKQFRIPFTGVIIFKPANQTQNQDTINKDNRKRNGSSVRNPVKILEFKARAEDKRVILSWITQTEDDDTGKFVVENSSDGVSFQEIGIVKGAGKSDDPVNYLYTDEHPYESTNYYRLKQVDNYGNYKYFSQQPTSVKLSTEHEIKIWPNPSDGQTINLFIKPKKK